MMCDRQYYNIAEQVYFACSCTYHHIGALQNENSPWQNLTDAKIKKVWEDRALHCNAFSITPPPHTHTHNAPSST